MSVLVEQYLPLDYLLQAAFRDQDILQLRVSKLWQRMVFLQRSEFLRQCSKTTRNLLSRKRCESPSRAVGLPHHEGATEDNIDVESPYVRPLSKSDHVDEQTQSSCGNPADRLQKCCRGFRAQAKTICRSLDSDATDSSSGGESDEELEIPHKKRLSQPSLAAQRVAKAEYEAGRAQIASKIGWLSAQISDLEHRIRIQHDMVIRQRSLRRYYRLPHQQARQLSVSSTTSQTSLPSQDIESAAGVSSQATGSGGSACNASSPANVSTSSQKSSSGDHAARAQPFSHLPRRQHLKCPNAATRFLDQAPAGEAFPWFHHVYDPSTAQKQSGASCLSPTIMEQLDRSYHPVLSFHSDIPLSVCLESSIRHREHQSASGHQPHSIRRSSFKHSKKLRLPRSKSSPCEAGRTSPIAPMIRAAKRANSYGGISLASPSALAVPLTPTPLQQRKSEGARRPKGISLASESCMGGSSTSRTPVRRSADSGLSTPTAGTPGAAASFARQHSQSASKRLKRGTSTSYDINSIVVQYAAPSRVEKIHYKEIETPRWRLFDALSLDESMDVDEEVEELSDESFAKRHATLEAAERIRFQGGDKKRRTNRGSSSFPTTPEAPSTAPASPATAAAIAGNHPLRISPVDATYGFAPLHDDATSASVLSRKVSRKTPSVNRSVSSQGDLDSPVVPYIATPWEPRVFPLSDADLECLHEEQLAPQLLDSSAGACQLSASCSGNSLVQSQPPSLGGSRASSNPSSPCASAGAQSSKLALSSPNSQGTNWSVRLPSPKPQGKEMEESKPPLLLKLTKHAPPATSTS